MTGLERFDAELAMMTFRKGAERYFTTDVPRLIDEYTEICSVHAADPVARNLHLSFVRQVDQMRALLTTVRPNQNAAHQLGNQTSTVIIRQEWNKDHYKKLRFGWNAPIRELTAQVTEAAVAWLLQNDQYEGYAGFVTRSETTCYVPSLGVVLQQWADKKDAKNYVDSLFVAINAPMSKFYAPCAMCSEILGTTVVALSLCPIECVWVNWRDTPLAYWAFDAVCASMRLTKLSSPKLDQAGSPASPSAVTSPGLSGAGGGGASSGKTPAELAVERFIGVSESDLPNVKMSSGLDGKWYVLDFRSLPMRALHSIEEAAKRIHWPRRELLYSAAGVVSTPYTPTEFITKFKLKVIADQLLNIGGAGAPGPADQSLISSLMHFHGVSFGSYIFHLFYAVVEQERVFLAGIQTANRKGVAMTPNTVAKLKRFSFCKSLILSELAARVIKRFIREEWRRVAQSKHFTKSLLAAINEGDDADDFDVDSDQKILELNQPFIDAVNQILQAVFTPTAAGAHPPTEDDPASPRHLNRNGVLQMTIEPSMLETLLYIMNEVYVVSACAANVVKGTARFMAKEEDIDITRVVFCLNEMLGLGITLKPRKVFLEGTTDFFSEEFFDLEGVSGCALRSEQYAATVELPICLVTGSKAKMSDFVDLQQRIASKILTTIDVSQSPSIVSHLVCVVKFVLLYANDVQVAQRGVLQEQDYEDIARVNGQVPFRLTPHAQKMLFAFDAMIAFRRAWFCASVDLQGALRNLMRSAEKCRPLFESTTGSAMVLAEKIAILCQVCEHFIVAGMELVTSLEMALQDLNQLLQPSGALGANRLAQLRRAGGGGPVGAPAGSGQAPMLGITAPSGGSSQQLQGFTVTGGGSSGGELRLVHCYPLHLALLSLLVKHVLSQGNKSQSDAIGMAVRHCSRRRDVICEVFGEKSVEAGLACNDVAAICSNNKYDFEKAEEEFERAVLILREAQPEGPALFVTMNNLAFLYFRKAERMRKNPQLAKEMVHKESIGEILVKAEDLLRDVIAAEGRVGVLDFAAALNNLASIKLFLNQFNDARKYFTKTLETTEHLVRDGEGELPCRAHAIKNMKVLARKQYVAAVLKVQANVRRFIAKMRNQKQVTLLRAAKPLQRYGRGLLTRLFLARHYRFSGFNSWLRKPRIFTYKLDPSYHPLPLVARREAWFDLQLGSARRLQRIMRAFGERRFTGKVFNFNIAHFAHRRPMLIAEVTRRRTIMFSAEALRVLIITGAQAFAELVDIQLRCTRYGSYIAIGDTHIAESRAMKQLIESAEESSRFALSQTHKRGVTEIANFVELHLIECEETLARRRAASRAFESLHGLVGDFVWPLQRHVFVRDIANSRDVARLEMLERMMRNNIVVEFTILMRGEYMISIVPRVGRGFLMRKWANRMRTVLIREEMRRREIAAEESSQLHFPSLERRWQALTVEDVETQARKRIVAEWTFFNEMQEKYSDIAVVLTEFNARARLEELERRAFQREITDVCAQDVIILAERVARTNSVIVEEAVHFMEEVIAGAEAVEARAIAAQYSHETLVAIKRSAEFALTMKETHEALERHALRRVEQLEHFTTIEHPMMFEAELLITESRAWSDLVAFAQHEVRRQIMVEERREGDERERQEVVTEERSARQWHEDAAISAFWPKVASSFFAAALEILERDAVDRGCFMIEREETADWFSIRKHILHVRARVTTLLSLAEFEETSLREIIANEREAELRATISDPNAAALEVIATNFVASAFGPASLRTATAVEEARAALELEAFGGFVKLLREFFSDDLYFSINFAQVERRERSGRQALVGDLHSAERALLEHLAEFRLHEVRVALTKKQLQLPMAHLENTETLHRLTMIDPAESEERAVIVMLAAQSSQRVALRTIEAIEFIATIMLHRHVLFVHGLMTQKLVPAMTRHHRAFLTTRDAISNKEASLVLARCLSGMRTRAAVHRLRLARRAAVNKLQRIGRAFYVRRRTAVLFAELVEHCFFYASELKSRQAIEREEREALNFAVKFQQFVGYSFLRSYGRMASTARMQRAESVVLAARSPSASSRQLHPTGPTRSQPRGGSVSPRMRQYRDEEAAAAVAAASATSTVSSSGLASHSTVISSTTTNPCGDDRRGATTASSAVSRVSPLLSTVNSAASMAATYVPPVSVEYRFASPDEFHVAVAPPAAAAASTAAGASNPLLGWTRSYSNLAPSSRADSGYGLGLDSNGSNGSSSSGDNNVMSVRGPRQMRFVSLSGSGSETLALSDIFDGANPYPLPMVVDLPGAAAQRHLTGVISVMSEEGTSSTSTNSGNGAAPPRPPTAAVPTMASPRPVPPTIHLVQPGEVQVTKKAVPKNLQRRRRGAPTAQPARVPSFTGGGVSTSLFEVPAWQSSRLFAAKNSNPAPRLTRKLADHPEHAERVLSMAPLGPTDGDEFVEVMRAAGSRRNFGIGAHATRAVASPTLQVPVQPQPPPGPPPSHSARPATAGSAPAVSRASTTLGSHRDATPSTPRRKLDFTSPRPPPASDGSAATSHRPILVRPASARR